MGKNATDVKKKLILGGKLIYSQYCVAIDLLTRSVVQSMAHNMTGLKPE